MKAACSGSIHVRQLQLMDGNVIAEDAGAHETFHVVVNVAPIIADQHVAANIRIIDFYAPSVSDSVPLGHPRHAAFVPY